MWLRMINTILGIWLMAAPAILSYSGPAQTNDRIVGPMAASFAVIAMWEVTRPVRWVNTLLGLWLLAAPWVLGYDALVPILNSLIMGAAMMLVSIAGGKVTQHFGGGWASLWKSGTFDQEQQIDGGTEE